jgi:hypothetical protein
MDKYRGYETGGNPVDTDPNTPDAPNLGDGEIIAPRTSAEYHVPAPAQELFDDSHARGIARDLLDDKIPEKKKFWTKGKTIATAAIAGVGLTAGLALGLTSKSTATNTPQPSDSMPSAGAPPVPGSETAPSTQEVDFDSYTLETFPFEINGETIVGVEGLREKYGLDATANPDADSMVHELAGKLNQITSFGRGPEKDLYAKYVSPNGDGEGIRAVSHDFLLPALAEVWGATQSDILKPGADPSDYTDLEPPTQLLQMVEQAVIGNVKYPENGQLTYEVKDIQTVASVYDSKLNAGPGTTSSTDNNMRVEVKIDMMRDGRVTMANTGWGFNAFRVPAGQSGKDQYLLSNFANYTSS